MRLAESARSTEKNEPVGLSTRHSSERRIVIVIGSWLRLPEQKGLGLFAPVSRSAARERSKTCGRFGPASGCKTLHPPRPSGRSPHRPLIFLAAFSTGGLARNHRSSRHGVPFPYDSIG